MHQLNRQVDLLGIEVGQLTLGLQQLLLDAEHVQVVADAGTVTLDDGVVRILSNLGGVLLRADLPADVTQLVDRVADIAQCFHQTFVVLRHRQIVIGVARI